MIQDGTVQKKVSIPAIIQTVTQRIDGDIHIREWQRVKDYLDHSQESYMAVTNATVYNFRGEALYQFPFLAINLAHVVWLNPKDTGQEQVAP